MSRLPTYFSFVRFSHSVFALPFALTGALLAWRDTAVLLVAGGLDRRLHGERAQRRDGIQPPGRCAVRRAEPADVDARAAARRDVDDGKRRCSWSCRRSSSSTAPRGSARSASLLSPVALAIVFWYSLAKRVHVVHAVVPRARHGGCAGRRMDRGRRASRGSSRGCSASRSACGSAGSTFSMPARTSSSTVRHGLRSIPDAVRRRRRPSCCPRVMHVATVVGDGGAVARRRSAAVCTSLASRSSACLLAYEQSLVSERDLSQVKRAFDLNGYVGIIYFAATALSLYLG